MSQNYPITIICTQCCGSGVVKIQEIDSNYRVVFISNTCPACNGIGYKSI